jgi:hypothetical protein
MLIPQHLIVGTNNVARFGPVLSLGPGKRWCQRLPGVPAGAGYARLGVVRAQGAEVVAANKDYSQFGRVAAVGVTVTGAPGKRWSGQAAGFGSGRIDVPLDAPTAAAARGRICIANMGDKLVSLLGEAKRGPGKTTVPKAAVTFLSADRTTWLSRRHTIARRFQYSHAGLFGTWALPVGVLLMVLAAALAMWLIVTRARDA